MQNKDEEEEEEEEGENMLRMRQGNKYYIEKQILLSS